MKYKDMPSVKARDYAKKTLPTEYASHENIVRNRVERAYMAGYDAARKRFNQKPSGKKEEQK